MKATTGIPSPASMLRILAVPLLVLFAAAALPAKVVHVAPGGNDDNPGTRERPLASIQKALESLKGAPGTVVLEAGRYFTARGLVLKGTIGGTAENPVVIRSAAPRAAIISGAKQVAEFAPVGPAAAKALISKEARKTVVVADLKAQGFPPLTAMPKQFRAPGREEVIFGDRPLQAARWPNEGFAVFTEVVDAGASKPVHWVTREVYRPGSFRFPGDRPQHWDFSRGVYLHGFWCYDWSDEVLKAADYDASSRELTLAAKHRYGIGNPWNKKSKRKFYAVHVFAELDAPGEYYLDRANNRLYLRPPGDIEKTPVWVSICRAPLLTADGVSHLRLEGLVFENGCDEAIRLKHCTNVTVTGCLVRNTGRGGVTVSGGKNNHVLACAVTRTGSRGVAVHAGDRKTLTAGDCSVERCHLHHVGRHDWQGGRGVTLGGCGNRVSRNLIHHCPTGGVSYGGNEHVLECNEVHHVCLLYSDVGVFYTGRDWASRGNVVRWNYIHSNTNNTGHGSSAIYLDDCDSGDRVVGNIVVGGVGRGVLLGGGRDNTIRGNVFIDLPRGIHVDARGPRGITLEKPGSWNLKATCERVGYHSPLWKKRYPRLATVLEHDPKLPMGNVIEGNILVGCAKDFDLRKGVKRAWLTMKDNRAWPLEKFPFLQAAADGAAPDLKQLSAVWKDVPGFRPIPIENIGPGEAGE